MGAASPAAAAVREMPPQLASMGTRYRYRLGSSSPLARPPPARASQEPVREGEGLDGFRGPCPPHLAAQGYAELQLCLALTTA